MDSIKDKIYNSLKIDDMTIENWTNTNYSADMKTSLGIIGLGNDADIIYIIGDYDCDGICGTHILDKSFKELYPKELYPNKEIISLIPTRTEGYGINERIVNTCKEHSKEKKVFVITVDTGIASKDYLEDLKKNGCTVCITDHHELKDKDLLPDVDLIIDPGVTFIENPLIGRNWCGAAVAFKLMENLISPTLRKYLLPFAGIATIADIIPMREGSWQLVKTAIEELRINAPYNLKLLINTLGRDIYHINEGDIGYYIGPAINAPGRLESKGVDIDKSGASLILNFFNNPEKKTAEHIKELNDKRKEIRDEELQKVIDVIIAEEKEYNDKIWVYVPGLHSGIIGLIAGQIVEKYHTSAFICTNDENGNLRGSARRYKDFEGFNIYDYLSENKDNLIAFGGHEKAAGFSLTKENFVKIEKETKKVVVTLKDDLIDIKLNDIPHINRIMTILRPFGEEYKEPVYKTEINLNEVDYSMIGQEKNHLSISGTKWKAIHFNHTNSELNNKNQFIAKGRVNSNYFRGVSTPQLIINEVIDEDIKEHNLDDLDR